METNTPNEQNRSPRGSAFGAVLVAVLLGPVSAIMPLCLLAAPAFWAAAALKTRPAMLALFGAAYAATALLIMYPVNAIVMSVCVVAAALALYWLQIRRLGNTNTALALAGVFVAGLYLSLCLPSILAGNGAFDALEQAAAESIALWRGMLPEALAADAAMAAQWNLVLDAVTDSVSSTVVPLLSIGAAILALSNLTLFRGLAKGESERLAPMQPFCRWSIPRSMMTGLFVMLVGALLFGWSGWTHGVALTSAVQTIVGMPLLLQGLCVIDFYITRKSARRTATRILVYTMLGLFLWLLQTPLILLGCIEQVFGIRRRMLDGPTSRPMTL